MLEHVKALPGLICMVVGQVTVDKGSWALAALMLHLPEPPWSLIARRSDDSYRAPSRGWRTRAGVRRSWAT